MKKILNILDYFAPFANAGVFLFLRIWIAIIFWQSGLTKIASWESTLFLFEEEYAVPYLPVSFAAISATIIELTAPILLVIGLGSRFVVVPLLVMTAVIQFTYMQNHDHIIWALALLAILFHGAGKFSWDFFLRTKFLGNAEKSSKVLSFIAILIVAALTIIAAHEAIAAFTDIPAWLEKMLKCFSKI